VVSDPSEAEQLRTARLLDAQGKAVELFAQIEQRQLVVPGISLTELRQVWLLSHAPAT